MSNDLEKLSDRKLADMFGLAKKDAKETAGRLKKVTEELVRRGKVVYVGASFSVQKKVTETYRFDSGAVKIEMGDAWYNARKALTVATEWIATVKPLGDLPPAPALVPPKPKGPKPAAATAERALEDA